MSSNSRLARDAKAIRDQTGIELSKAKRLVQGGAKPLTMFPTFQWSKWEVLNYQEDSRLLDYGRTAELYTEDGGTITMTVYGWGIVPRQRDILPVSRPGDLIDVKYSAAVDAEWNGDHPTILPENINGDFIHASSVDDAGKLAQRRAILIAIERHTAFVQPGSYTGY